MIYVGKGNRSRKRAWSLLRCKLFLFCQGSVLENKWGKASKLHCGGLKEDAPEGKGKIRKWPSWNRCGLV